MLADASCGGCLVTYQKKKCGYFVRDYRICYIHLLGPQQLYSRNHGKFPHSQLTFSRAIHHGVFQTFVEQFLADSVIFFLGY